MALDSIEWLKVDLVRKLVAAFIVEAVVSQILRMAKETQPNLLVPSTRLEIFIF